MVILGLDASTTCVGYAFTEDKKILDMGFIDIKKEKTPKDKVQKVLDFLHQISYIDNVDNINIEDKKTFANQFPLLLLITMFIITIVKSSLALSLGLVGALSIVRFRNPVRSSFELTIYFFMITIGICASVSTKWMLLIGLVSISIIFLSEIFIQSFLLSKGGCVDL